MPCLLLQGSSKLRYYDTAVVGEGPRPDILREGPPTSGGPSVPLFSARNDWWPQLLSLLSSLKAL